MAETVVNSSTVLTYDYDSESHVLHIKYKMNGSEWDYHNITQSTVDAVFNSGGSVGSKFHHLIKRGQYKSIQVG